LELSCKKNPPSSQAVKDILKGNKTKSWKFVNKLPIFAPLRKGGTVTPEGVTSEKRRV
jgi:hypothetical protein